MCGPINSNSLSTDPTAWALSDPMVQMQMQARRSEAHKRLTALLHPYTTVGNYWCSAVLQVYSQEFQVVGIGRVRSTYQQIQTRKQTVAVSLLGPDPTPLDEGQIKSKDLNTNGYDPDRI